MPVSVKLQNHESGGRVEMGTFTLAANAGGALATDLQATDAVTITGAKVGDLIFVSEEAPDVKTVVAGAKVTAADTVTVYTQNAAATSVTPTSKTYNYILVHLS